MKQMVVQLGDLGLRLPRNGKFQDINVLILGCRGVGVQIPGLSSKQQTRTVIANCRIAEGSLELSGLESQVETAKNLILSNVSNSAIVKKMGGPCMACSQFSTWVTGNPKSTRYLDAYNL